MPEPSRTERKLAAIMFLDMVGYTRLMQENEAEAVAKRDRHREVLRREVAEHGGEILQYWGDGTLCLFGSAVEAVHCAADIQRAMQEPPEIPLRIGIHLGDVTRDEEGLYGDGVNIAARIESLSVPGAVLVSKKVRDEIKNQEGFSCLLLGSFLLKNVSEPVDVYAVEGEGLYLPEAREIKGKGQRMPEEVQPSDEVHKSKGWWARLRQQKPVYFWTLMIALLLALGSVAAWLAVNSSEKSGNSLSGLPTGEDGVLTLAVLPLENRTGDPGLNLLSNYLLEPVLQNFQREKQVKLLSPGIVQKYSEYLGTPSFHELTGAEMMISGSYYLENQDTLSVNVGLTNVLTGVEEERLVASAPREQKRRLAADLTQKILGGWMMFNLEEQGDKMFGFNSQPPYEATQAYYTGLFYYLADDRKALEYFQKTYQIDSTFIQPLGMMMIIHYQQGNDQMLDSLMERFMVLIEKNDPGGIYVFDFWDGIREREARRVHNAVTRAIEQNDFMDAGSISSYMLTSIALNDPKKAVEFADELEEGGLPDEFTIPMHFSILAWYTYACNLTGEYQKSLEVLNRFPPAATKSAFTHAMHLRALVRTDQLNELEAYIEAVSNMDLNLGDAPALLYLQTAWEMTLQGNDALAQSFAQRAVEEYFKLPVEKQSWYLPYAYLLAGDLENTEHLLLALEQQEPLEPRHKGLLGVIQTRQVEPGDAEQYLDELQALPDDYGWKAYWTAIIHANMKQPELAMQHLREAREKGLELFFEGMPYFWWNTFKNDVHLMPLFDNPEFQAFVKPKDS